jgi:hypothetical protein
MVAWAAEQPASDAVPPVAPIGVSSTCWDGLRACVLGTLCSQLVTDEWALPPSGSSLSSVPSCRQAGSDPFWQAWRRRRHAGCHPLLQA